MPPRRTASGILGDPDFLKHIKEKYIYGREKLDTEIPEERRISGVESANRIIRECSTVFSKTRESILESRRGEVNHARLTALLLTRELSGLKLSEIANVFEIKSYRTVASNCFRHKKRLEQNPQTKQRYAKIYKACSQEKI